METGEGPAPGRCAWASGGSLVMIEYHDRDWGVPVHDDRLLFEMLVLEGAQAGLSWSTVLRKREGYRRAFAGFDPAAVAGFDEATCQALLQDPGIVRNRLKVQSAVQNARAFLDVQGEFGSFDRFLWQLVDGKPIQNARQAVDGLPATSPESDRLSKELRRRGFRFVGSTICYAYMQSVGLVNDHVVTCFRREELAGSG